MSLRSIVGENQDAFDNGLPLLPPGEYVLLAGTFRVLHESRRAVIACLVESGPDGEDCAGHEIPMWLMTGTKQAAAIAGERLRSLQLSMDDFEDENGKLPRIVRFKGVVKASVGRDGVTRNEIGKIVEVLGTEEQSPASGLEEL